jgi:hypothetical protein
MSDVIFSLMLWLWLQKESIGMFARECLQGAMGKDVLYNTMNRENLNWRKFHEHVAYKAVHTLKPSDKKAYVLGSVALADEATFTICYSVIRLLCCRHIKRWITWLNWLIDQRVKQQRWLVCRLIRKGVFNNPEMEG